MYFCVRVCLWPKVARDSQLQLEGISHRAAGELLFYSRSHLQILSCCCCLLFVFLLLLLLLGPSSAASRVPEQSKNKVQIQIIKYNTDSDSKLDSANCSQAACRFVVVVLLLKHENSMKMLICAYIYVLHSCTLVCARQEAA